MASTPKLFEVAKAAGLTDRQLAAKLGKSPSIVSRVRNGQAPSWDFIDAALKAFPGYGFYGLFSPSNSESAEPAA